MGICITHKVPLKLVQAGAVYDYHCPKCREQEGRVYKERLHQMIESMSIDDVIAMHDLLVTSGDYDD